MGIPGWNRLLAEEGWLPDKSQSKGCCSTSLWMDLSMTVEQMNPRFSESIVAIPPGSELHVDGYCLCFHIYETAYARYIDRVLYSKSNHQQRPCTRYKNLRALSPNQVRHLLPSFLPLKLLADVTTEFIQMLRKHGMQITVYWDGEKRYSFKLATDNKRQSKFDAEWSDVQQYCLYGRMPAVESLCEWEKVLPKHRLFATQTLHALTVARVNVIFCEEEADHVLAQAASGQPHAYVVGLDSDSDFCFFPAVNYIPISTLDVRTNTVTACVLQRDKLAASLDLPDEQAMVELAILMGNDYVDPANAGFQNCPVAGIRNTAAVLAFLREQGQGYLVTSSSFEVEEALRFVRLLYNLQDLSEFSFLSDGESENGDDSVALNQSECDSEENNDSVALNGESSLASLRPQIPDELIDLQLAAIQPLKDRSVKEAVLRCLQAYVDRALVDNHRTMLTQEHLSVFQQLVINERQSYKDVDKEIVDKAWRPVWEDVAAVYLIEKIISKSIWGSPGSPLVRLNPPYNIFDQYKFHALLRTTRERGMLPTVKNDLPLLLPQAVAVKLEPLAERPTLPVDEFENIILESIRKHRVTIIQGDTGCGTFSNVFDVDSALFITWLTILYRRSEQGNRPGFQSCFSGHLRLIRSRPENRNSSFRNLDGLRRRRWSSDFVLSNPTFATKSHSAWDTESVVGCGGQNGCCVLVSDLTRLHLFFC
jgi:hypothetical protein